MTEPQTDLGRPSSQPSVPPLESPPLPSPSVHGGAGTTAKAKTDKAVGPGTVPAVGLMIAGILVVIAGAWSGIVPFIGASIGHSADGTSTWTWNLAHSLLWLVPGAVAVVCGLAMVMMTKRARFGRARMGCTLAGVGALVAGAWLVLGPIAWPVLKSGSPITADTAMKLFVERVIYSLAPGLVLVVLGAMVAGWGVRPRRLPDAEAVAQSYPARAAA